VRGSKKPSGSGGEKSKMKKKNWGGEPTKTLWWLGGGGCCPRLGDNPLPTKKKTGGAGGRKRKIKEKGGKTLFTFPDVPAYPKREGLTSGPQNIKFFSLPQKHLGLRG